MATIKKFEDIVAWQKARALNQIIGDYIDTGRFKSNFRLINQIEGSAGSIMDNIAEGLNVVETASSYSSYTFQKVHAESLDLNYIEH